MNERLFHWINDRAGHIVWLDHFFVFFTQSALTLVAVILGGLWCFGGTSLRKSVLFSGITGLVALFIGSELVPLIYSHPRPFVVEHVHQLVQHAADQSFPSDHATGSFAIAFVLWKNHRKWGSAFVAFAVLIGFSRVYCGIHYPIDIAGGAVVALVALFMTLSLQRFINPVVDKIVSFYEAMVRALMKRYRLFKEA